jgi:hypothetical protein
VESRWVGPGWSESSIGVGEKEREGAVVGSLTGTTEAPGPRRVPNPLAWQRQGPAAIDFAESSLRSSSSLLSSESICLGGSRRLGEFSRPSMVFPSLFGLAVLLSFSTLSRVAWTARTRLGARYSHLPRAGLLRARRHASRRGGREPDRRIASTPVAETTWGPWRAPSSFFGGGVVTLWRVRVTQMGEKESPCSVRRVAAAEPAPGGGGV